MIRYRSVAICSSLMLFVPACYREQPGEIARQAFYRPETGGAAYVRRPTPEDQAGQIMYDDVSMNLLDPDEAKRKMAEEEAARTRVTGISPAVAQAVTLPSVAALPGGPTTRPGQTTGGYMQLGAVVTSVNGVPIYADKVLASLEKVLATEARQRDERSFRAFARGEIEKQTGQLIRTELEVAAANRNLDKREQALADEATARFRRDLITQAGGSVERARAKAAAEGVDFDKMIEDKHREYQVQLLYQKRIFPRVQVSAEEMRRYYNQHLKQQFTQQDEAHFRVIRIDGKKTGDINKAKEKIDDVRRRALGGEDFAKLASSINDDPNLMRAAGDVGSVQRGAFALEPVEEAVWKIQPGQITEPIKIGDSYYIARLEERKQGHVRPFEDREVQKSIEDALRKEQINARRRTLVEALRQDAVIYPDPPVIDPVVEMAMQRYPLWASPARTSAQ
jgi:parvulin-like peptidyl-prolyl isomerase